jgi:hypothetical protein
MLVSSQDTPKNIRTDTPKRSLFRAIPEKKTLTVKKRKTIHGLLRRNWFRENEGVQDKTEDI